MSRCMCCNSRYDCSCTDIQRSVIDLANANQVVDMQKLEIDLLKEENARLREALESKLAKAVEENVKLKDAEEVLYISEKREGAQYKEQGCDYTIYHPKVFSQLVVQGSKFGIFKEFNRLKELNEKSIEVLDHYANGHWDIGKRAREFIEANNKGNL